MGYTSPNAKFRESASRKARYKGLILWFNVPELSQAGLEAKIEPRSTFHFTQALLSFVITPCYIIIYSISGIVIV